VQTNAVPETAEETLVVLCACPNEETARGIAETLVQEHLAACVNRMAGVRSTYRWQGRIEDEPEVLLLIKTVRRRFEALELRLKALHPYDLPEIIALPVTAGSAQYLTWVATEVL
jgi:periplasmic divalent cation tolerance protein